MGNKLTLVSSWLRPLQRVQQTALLSIALAAAAIMPFAINGTASAASPCGAGHLCLFEHANFSGLYTEYYSVSNGCHNVSSTFNDMISSIDNRTSSRIVFYDDANCTGFIAKSVYAYSSRSDLQGSGINDEISSFQNWW